MELKLSNNNSLVFMDVRRSRYVQLRVVPV